MAAADEVVTERRDPSFQSFLDKPQTCLLLVGRREKLKVKTKFPFRDNETLLQELGDTKCNSSSAGIPEVFRRRDLKIVMLISVNVVA